MIQASSIFWPDHVVDVSFLSRQIATVLAMYADEEVQIHSRVVLVLDMLVESASILLMKRGTYVSKEGGDYALGCSSCRLRCEHRMPASEGKAARALRIELT